MTEYRLSKSKFTTGLQCHKLLWLSIHEPDAPELEVGDEQQALFDMGTRVGEVAQSHIPGGVLIDFPYYEIANKVEATQKALKEKAKVIYEASFIADDVFVAVDILEKTRGGWILNEVKASTKAKPEHEPDVAVQTYVLEKAGVTIKRVNLMHLNRECRYPNLSNLFEKTDLTAKARLLFPMVKRELRKQKTMLQGSLPDVTIGPFCTDPYECPFLTRCWPKLPEHHVSTLYRVGQKAVGLEAQGCATIRDLPDDYPLNVIQNRQRRSVKSRRIIAEATLQQELAILKKPIAFLDFETIAPAIPVWNGCRPYDFVPVQFSCHMQGGRGTTVHKEWIADGPGDPRRDLTEALIKACEGAETILAYNASFEKACIRQLIYRFPRMTPPLQKINDKIVDLLPIVRNHVYHPKFHGSFSLKSVLPALLPKITYKGMAIDQGNLASKMLEQLLFCRDEMKAKDRNQLRKDLLEYCKMDTLAMVKLLERLRKL